MGMELLTNSNTFKANNLTRIVHMYIYSYTVSVSVKVLYKSKVFTVCLLSNEQLNLNLRICYHNQYTECNRK